MTAGSKPPLAAGDIWAIAEPYLWMQSLTDRQHFGHQEISGIVKPSDDVAILSATPQEVRADLLAQADRLVAALSAAGWHLTDNLRAEFVTEVRPFSQYLSGELGEPSQQGCVTCTLTLEVGTPL
jgi:hypothetical protein